MATSSHNTEGAASAAPSIAIPEDASLAEIDRMEQAAYDAIENVQDPDEAEFLLRQVKAADAALRLSKVSKEREQRWGRLWLLAERRYGELLGEAEHGGDRKSDQVAGSDLNPSEKDARRRARKVAAVPKADFDEYVDNEPKPTRSGLFHKTTPPMQPRRTTAPKAPLEAAERLQERVKQVRGCWLHALPRWTLEDVVDVEVVLKRPAKRQPKYSGKRLRQLAAKKATGHDLAGLQYRMVQLIGILEGIDVTSYELADADDVSEFHDDLVELQLWMDKSISLASMRLGDAALETKIRHLRNTNGRTEPERLTALRLADKLERKRREQHLATRSTR